jgi:DNA-binding MarR family transcriptional regulator/GNAT superfamily N-acetyltransferase
MTDMVAAFRRFNRTVTQQVGALNDHFLAQDRPLAGARLLWEIGPDGAEVRSLRTRLDLDSGHLSRLLRSLENDGLVVVRAGSADGRIRTAYLTEAGQAERAVLDQRSDDLARSLLAPLSRRQQDRLVAAMQDVERLLTAAGVTIRTVDPGHADARAGIRAYLAELGRRFPEGFDPDVGVTAEPHELRVPAGELLVAYLRSEPVGCGAVKHHRDDGWSEIKRVWVADAVRGLGLGRRLLAELEGRARAAGAAVVRLDTHRTLTEATALYRSAGYREIAAYNDNPYAHHWFEKSLR